MSRSRDYPQRGRQAILADPDGVVFAVLAAQGGDPPDDLAAPGEWIWTALFVADPTEESAFYRTLFGYRVDDLANDDGNQDEASHHVLSSDNARVGLNALPVDSVHRRAHWLNFPCVTEGRTPEDAAHRAASENDVERRTGHVSGRSRFYRCTLSNRRLRGKSARMHS